MNVHNLYSASYYERILFVKYGKLHKKIIGTARVYRLFKVLYILADLDRYSTSRREKIVLYIMQSILGMCTLIFVLCGIVLRDYTILFLIGVCCTFIFSFAISAVKNWRNNRKHVCFLYFVCSVLLLWLNIFLFYLITYTQSFHI